MNNEITQKLNMLLGMEVSVVFRDKEIAGVLTDIEGTDFNCFKLTVANEVLICFNSRVVKWVDVLKHRFEIGV